MEIDDNIFQAIQACWTGKASPEQIELVRDWLEIRALKIKIYLKG